MKTVRLIWTFYRSFCLVNALMTIICLLLFYQYGYPIFAAVFWLKAGTLLLVYRYISSYKRHEFYYYQNLGVSKRLLWISTLSVDMVLYLLLITQLPHP